MFDLVDRLKKDESKVIAEEKITTVLFHQTDACRRLVSEAFRFEGISDPALVENSDDAIKQYVREASIEIVLVELNNSIDVSQDMERIRHLLPNHASVVVIGSEDAISTIRNLKAMGFYYLFWPITKQELIDFVRSVNDNRATNSGLGKNRKAKQVAFWGTKGGVGTSMLTSEVAFELSERKNSNCVVVDHNFQGGNLDILMGLRQFEKKSVQKGSVSSSLDMSYASGMTTKVNDMLSILSLASTELNEFELKEYITPINEQLIKQTNFIIEDLSRSANSKADLSRVTSSFDSIVLVLEPTLSSLREATRIKSEIDASATPARIFVVVNYTLPEKFATATLEEIEKYLRHKVDVVCPYTPDMDAYILEGKRLYARNNKLGKSLSDLTSQLLGEELISKKTSLLSRFRK